MNRTIEDDKSFIDAMVGPNTGKELEYLLPKHLSGRAIEDDAQYALTMLRHGLMNKEELMVLQMSLRDIMFTVMSHKGVVNLQKVIPRIEEYQSKVNNITKENRIELANVINGMSID